jgi:hypothetical protein
MGATGFLDEANNLRFFHFSSGSAHGAHDLGEGFFLGFALESEGVFNQLLGVIFGREAGAFGLGEELSHALTGEGREFEGGWKGCHTSILSRWGFRSEAFWRRLADFKAGRSRDPNFQLCIAGD